MTAPRSIRYLLTLGLLSGCHSVPAHRPSSSQSASSQSTSSTVNWPNTNANRPLAYLDGEPITANDLLPDMLETSGGQALVDLLIDRALQQRLAERSMTIQPQEIESEKNLLLESLADDPNQAQRLLNELREARALGDARFAKLLRRNASLRQLVAGQVQVTEAAIQQAYRLRYGEKHEARLITANSLSQAAELLRLAQADNSSAGFANLAIAHSTDSSRAQGGLLPPVSPQDATFPLAIRQALAAMETGEISNPVALENSFAILRLERKIASQSVRYDDVKAALARNVQVQLQRMLMQRLVREILQQSSPAITDAALDRSFLWQKRLLTAGSSSESR